ncbi:MAG TPA: hypothetical protein VLJ39_15525 [Tepidisphaeraceae bacterium]|nr:hypothetical protein [Tepidisphaeraceae bacterium]
MGIFNNAIAWSQFRLLGGWKNLAATCGAYFVVFAGLMFGLAYGLRQPAGTTFSVFIGLFLAIQVLALLLYGTVRVAGAVRGDVRSGMLESHRLMPFGSGAAVLGYLFGAPLQAFLLFGANYILGAIAVNGAGLPEKSWVYSNAILLAFALTLWSGVLFFAFRSAFALWGGILVLFGILVSMQGLFVILPAAAVLVTPLRGDTIFDMRTGMSFETPDAASLAAQFAIACLFLLAARRRYDEETPVAFSPLLGLGMLATFVAVSIVGIVYVDQFGPSFSWRESRDTETAFVTTYTLALLLAILPISSAVRMWHDRTVAIGRRRTRPVVVVLLAALVTLALTSANPVGRLGLSRGQDAMVLRTALVTLAFLVTTRYITAIIYLLRLSCPRITLFAWLLATLSFPLLVEVVIEAFSDDRWNRHMTQVAMCSPVGDVYQIWSRYGSIHSEGFLGTVVQCVLAVCVAGAYFTLKRKRQTVFAPPLVVSTPGLPA